MSRLALTLATMILSSAIVGPVGAAAPLSAPQFYPSWAGSPFSEAVQAGDFLILSGQVGGGGGKGPIADESRRVMDRIAKTLQAHDASMDDVVKCTVMLTDMSLWDEFNTVYVSYFKPDRRPARSAFGAAGLAANARVEVECWAYHPTTK